MGVPHHIGCRWCDATTLPHRSQNCAFGPTVSPHFEHATRYLFGFLAGWLDGPEYDQTRANAQPRNVHPRIMFRQTIAAVLLCRRRRALIVGAKYMNTANPATTNSSVWSSWVGASRGGSTDRSTDWCFSMVTTFGACGVIGLAGGPAAGSSGLLGWLGAMFTAFGPQGRSEYVV